MSFQFRPAKRENVSLLIGLAGGTGSGKTYSAMTLAKGLAGDKNFAVIDTEAGRAKHYADEFSFDHGDLGPPFSPDAYAGAIAAADEKGYPVIVVDSASHEHAGTGGLLDWHEQELNRLAGDDWKRREAMTFSAWVKPKMAHKQFVSRLLQIRAHLILCFRAEEKIEIVKVDGKTQVRPKKTLTGLDGWVPVCEKNLPYELTLSFLLTALEPGLPRPIKIPARLRALVPVDQPIGEETGQRLAEWAHGDASPDEDGWGDDGDGALSYDAFKTRLEAEQIPQELVSELGRSLYPGKSASKLTNAQRGELLAALMERAKGDGDAEPDTPFSPPAEVQEQLATGETES